MPGVEVGPVQKCIAAVWLGAMIVGRAGRGSCIGAVLAVVGSMHAVSGPELHFASFTAA